MATPLRIKPDYQLITDPAEFGSLIDRLIAEAKPVGYDVETSYEGEPRPDAQKHPEENFICGFSLTNSLAWARAVPIAFEDGPNIDPKFAAECLWRLAAARDGQGRPLLVPHNAIFELRCTARLFEKQLGMSLEEAYFGVRSDTMVEAYIEAAHESYALKSLTRETFGHQMTEIMELFGDGLTKKAQDSIQFHLLDQTSPKVIDYMCEDALWALAHHLKRYPRVTDRGFRGAFLFKVDMAMLPVICAMSDTGIAYDWNRMREAAQRGQAFMGRLTTEINADLAAQLGRPIALSLASPAQIAMVLYDKDEGLGLPVKRRSKKTGKPSTDKLAVKALASEHPVVKKIQDYRRIKRLCMDNYAGKYEQDYDFAPDGRAHPNILPCAVTTGRLAFSRPAAQQPPKKVKYQLDSGETFEFAWRDCITVPPPGAMGDEDKHGWYILGFDLSQAELRAMAGEAQEPALLEAYRRGEDVHKLTGSKMLGIPFEEVTDEARSIGKAQPLDAPVLTPSGWRLMGELQVGDQVIGGDGQPVKVTGVFPQGRKQIYRVITSDGAVAECCGEHLWTVRNRNTHSRVWKTRSLSYLMEQGLRNATAGPTRGKYYRQPKYELPPRPVVQYAPPRRPPFSPYVLGALLGDGGFTQRLMFCSADRELLDAVRAEHERLGGRASEETDNGPGCRKFYLRAGQPYDRAGNVIKSCLEVYGLMGLRDHQKFIPEPYLRTSPEDRLALLQGLLDTDGNVLDSGAEFKVSSERLALGVQELARSLGGWASISSVLRERGKFNVKSDPLPIWKVYLRLPAGMCPFRMERKRANWKLPRYQAHQHIFSAEPAGEKECQCISVDSADGLYTTSDYLVTHNTLNLALQYQLSAPGLAERLGVPKIEGQRLYDAWFAAYPRVKSWTEATVAQAIKDGYTMSRFGRKHPIWEFAKVCQFCQSNGVLSKWTSGQSRCPRCNGLGTPKSMAVVAHGERLAGNAPIQGAATGDAMRIAMVRADKALKAAGLAGKVHMFLNVHDSLDFYVRKDVPPGEVIAVLQPAVVFPIEGWPEVVADWHAGTRMGSLAELEVGPDFSVKVKGAREEIAVPGDEDDEDEVELPTVDVAAVRAAAAKVKEERNAYLVEAQQGVQSAEPDGLGDPGGLVGGGAVLDMARRTVIVTVPFGAGSTPNLLRLKAALERLPGLNTVILRVAVGDVKMPGTSGLTPAHQPDVAFILPGAVVTYDGGSVDYAAIADGITV